MKFRLFYDMTPLEVVQEIDHTLYDMGFEINQIDGTMDDDSVEYEIVKL